MTSNLKTTTIAPSSATAQSNTGTLGQTFVANTLIQPDYDRIGYYLEESGRLQFCIPEEWLKLIRMAASMLTCERWRRDLWVSSRRVALDRYRVVKTNYGYRAQHAVVGTGYRHVLGDELAELPLLFPTAESAITTTEVVIQIEPLKRPELWRLTWLKPWCGLQAICASPTDSK